MGKSNEADHRDYLTTKRTVEDCETQQLGSVCQLKKAICGLKQLVQDWFRKRCKE